MVWWLNSRLIIIKITHDEAVEWCKLNSKNDNILYFETSVKCNINVDEAFIKLTRGMLDKEKQKDSNHAFIPNQITLSNDGDKKNEENDKFSFLSFARSC